MKKIYNFDFDLNFDIVNLLNQIDRFDASWTTIEKLQGASLNHLKTLATIQSVGSSTRIEGSKLTDSQVKNLLDNIDISQLTDRDKQEVGGYFKALDLITSEFDDISIIEGDIKNLHNVLMKFSEKDTWHKGNYKKHSNAVQATFSDGSTQIIFETADPSFVTEDAMRSLVSWYREKDNTPLLLKTAAFVYDFLSVHPFQDGNGRLSRLLTTLLLLKSGYFWIQYVSLEKEIEKNKKEYYNVLRRCQAQRPREDISDWIEFFLKSLLNIQKKLEAKLKISNSIEYLDLRQKSIYNFLTENPESKMKALQELLKLNRMTVYRLVNELVELDLVSKKGKGAGTNYSAKLKITIN